MDFENYKDILEYIPYNFNYDNGFIKTKLISESQLIDKIKNFCINEKKQKFIISLSGGVDSMVLICIILYLGYETIGIHINYNNRIETTKESEMLKIWCKINNIKLYVEEINNIKRNEIKREKYEKITQNIRFTFYKKILLLENLDTILLAHHKDDIIENIFANICRGRNLLNLAVIKEKTEIDNIIIGRPLLIFNKFNIYDFAHKYQIPYFKDTTPDWSVRGKYRKEILPKLNNTFSNFQNNLYLLNRQSEEWGKLIDEKIINPFFNNITFLDYNLITFNYIEYINYPLSFWKNIFIKLFHERQKKCPSNKSIDNFMNILKNNKIEKILLSDNCICFKKDSYIYLNFKNT